jgi:hypothetical protein
MAKLIGLAFPWSAPSSISLLVTPCPSIGAFEICITFGRARNQTWPIGESDRARSERELFENDSKVSEDVDRQNPE